MLAHLSGAVPFLLWCRFGVPGIFLVGWDLRGVHVEACPCVEPAAIVPVTPVQKDFNVGGGRLLHSRSKSIFLMKLCILIKRTPLVSITVWKHQHFVPHKFYLIRTDSNENSSVFVQWICSFFSPGAGRADTTCCMN